MDSDNSTIVTENANTDDVQRAKPETPPTPPEARPIEDNRPAPARPPKPHHHGVNGKITGWLGVLMVVFFLAGIGHIGAFFAYLSAMVDSNNSFNLVYAVIALVAAVCLLGSSILIGMRNRRGLKMINIALFTLIGTVVLSSFAQIADVATAKGQSSAVNMQSFEYNYNSGFGQLTNYRDPGQSKEIAKQAIESIGIAVVQSTLILVAILYFNQSDRVKQVMIK